MRAVLCKEWAGPESLVIEEVDLRDPGPGEVRMAIHATGLNFGDLLIIQGKYQEKPELPFSPGMESAGEIVAIGDGVTNVKVGDRVVGTIGHGGFAEEAVTDAVRVTRIPDSMDFVSAAAFPVAYGTSHVALRHRGNLKAGEWLLVHGAAGGVGLTAVQIGKVLGAKVIGTARGKDKLDVVTANGADHVIDYAEEPEFRKQVLELTDGKGVDVVYDPVGGDVFDESLRCTGWEGRLLVIGFAAGRIPKIPANYLLVKNISAVGVYWGAHMKFAPDILHDSLAELMQWFEDGVLAPHVSQTFDLEDTAAAMQLLAARKSTGKVVVTTGITRS